MATLFRNTLKKQRQSRGLTQAEVATILDVSPPRISEWERGVRTPKPLTQEAILLKLKQKKKKVQKKVSKKAKR